MKTSKGQQYFFFKFFLDSDSKRFIIINIQNEKQILVKASRVFLDTWKSTIPGDSWIMRQYQISNDNPASD